METGTMVCYTEHLTLKTERRYEIRDITEEVERVRDAAALQDGYVLVSTMHITWIASIKTNTNERPDYLPPDLACAARYPTYNALS